jgi:hypothetical protein
MGQGDQISPLLAPSPHVDFSEVIVGTISPNIADVSIINEHFNQPTQIELIETWVGQGRPRCLLNQLPQWS